jgi:hypothetical protein
VETIEGCLHTVKARADVILMQNDVIGPDDFHGQKSSVLSRRVLTWLYNDGFNYYDFTSS